MKAEYTVDSNGVHINGVTASNPVIYCNDMFFDSPEGFYLWLKANRKEVNLVGNISTRNMHIPPNIKNSHESTWKEWTEAYDKAMAIGLKNIPAPVKGSDDYLRKPSSGVIEQTQRKDSPGSDLIISEARKASASKPLVIFDGGFVTSLANAYLKDNSIADKVVIIHIDGWDNTMHNGVDYWATEIVMKKFRYIDWHGSFINNQVTWYDPFRPLQVTLNMPVNPWTNLLRDNYYNQSYAQWKDMGDAPGPMWFFDNSLWKNVVRRTANRQTTTSDNFDYLLVSDNDWPKYGPMLSDYMNNPTNYIPVTTQPPVNTAPTISILTSNTTYPAGSSIIITATASDDKAVSKVEFFNGSIKLGESLNSPYSWVINNATAGTYNLTGKATDNEGASTVSEVRVVTVTGVVIPPDPGQRVFDITKAPFFAKGDGLVDDGPAIQAAIDATIQASGKLYIPSAPNFYKHTQTLFIKPKDAQAYISIEGNGRYWGQLVYHGPSGQPAVVIEGLKGGSSILGLHSKIGDGIQDSAAFDIGTNNVSGSTSGFSLRNCTAELNRGVNNVGIRVGLREGPGADISQVVFDNVTCWGPFAIIKGQKGYHFAGANSFLFTLLGGGTVFCETGISVTAGGCITAVGYGTSQNDTELHLAHSTQISFTGGRFESSKRFLRVEQSANFPGVSLRDMVISDFKPVEGKLFDFQAPGGLMLDNVKIENSYDYDSRMFTLGNNGGTLSIRGGAFNASDPFLTQGGWRAKIENVVKLNRDYQSVGYFTNK